MLTEVESFTGCVDSTDPSTSLEQLLQKQATDVKKLVSLNNAQAEATTNLLGSVLLDRTPHEQENSQ